MQIQQTKSLTQTFQYLYKTDPRRFYRGVHLSLLPVALERALSFKYYEKLNNIFNPMVSGAIISLFSAVINVPSQYLCSNIALGKVNHNQRVSKFVVNEIKTNFFYKGFASELVKNYIAGSVYLGVYGNLRKLNGSQNHLTNFTNGVISSITMWSIIFPIDTIRTLKQTSSINQTYVQHISDRVKLFGIFSFWRGSSAVFIKSIPSAGCGMLVYEMVRSLTS